MTSNAGRAGAFAATDRGQPVQIFGSAEPFYIFDPKPGDIDLEVIAHALSLQCRFGGHCRVFYSVAQHCVLTARILHDSYWRHEALMHDAAEAYIGDVVRPLKMHLDLYQSAEAKLERVIAQRFELDYPWPAEVKEADAIMLATEKRDLLAPNDGDWGPMPEPLPWTIDPWPPEEAKARFLADAKAMGLK